MELGILIYKVGQFCADLVADAAEGLQDLLVGSLCFGGVFETPVDASCFAGKHRAVLRGVVADRDDKIERRAEKLVERFGTMGGYVDADLGHDGYSLWANKTRYGSGAFNFVFIARDVTQDAFGHLAAGRISGAEDQDSFLFHTFSRSMLDVKPLFTRGLPHLTDGH